MYSILYVDDEYSLLEIGKIFLEKDRAITVETVTSASLALERITSVSFDAIVSDYQMPEMDGIEFLKAVRSRFGDIPFILFTGRGREEVVIQAINHGVDFYLQKGGDPSSQFAELAHKLRMAIERRRAEQALKRETILNQAIFDSVPGILYLYDRDGSLIRWNKNHETLTGYSGEELAGWYVLDWFPDPVDKEIVRTVIERAFQEGQASVEASIAIKSGVKIQFLFTARRLQIGDRMYFTGIGIDITERKKAEEALHASEEKFRGISERSSDLIYVEDKDGIITYTSPSMERILGYMPDEVIGRAGDLFVLDEDLQKIRHGRDIKRSGGIFDMFNIRVKRKDGSVAVLDLQSIPIIQDGGFQGLQLIARDVTERWKVERALEESEELYRTLAENLPDYVIVHRGGTILYANRCVTGITGIRQEDLAGRSILDIVAPESRDLALEKMKQRSGGIATGWYEVKVLVGKGDERVALVNSAEILYKGSPATLLVMSDITAHKNLEISLRESEERFRVLTEHSLDVIMLFDRELKHLYVNPAVEKEMGISPREFIGKTHREMAFPASLVRLWEDLLERVFDSDAPMEVEFQIPNGTWVHWLLSPVHGTDGKVDQVLGSARIITKLKMTEETLRRANRQINLLGSITRHDINNKIMIIRGYLDIATKKTQDPVIQEYLRKIEAVTNTIQSQIAFTRVYKDLGTHEPQWQDLGQVIQRSPVPENITIKVDIDAIQVYADPLLEKVFFNLLDNSIRHGGGKISRIRFGFREVPEGLVITCDDDGTGTRTGTGSFTEEDFERCLSEHDSGCQGGW